MLVEVARILAEEGPYPRSILFVAFSGEERGLLGSAHYTSNAAVPLADTVAMVNLDAASDAALWQWATREDRIVVSKDEDLFFLANRRGDCGRLLWVRIGNCRRDALLRAFERALPSIVAAFESGQRIVELA
jgi:predicted nuclease of predicted toxin-antitoxin system